MTTTLAGLRTYFNSGITRSYSFRKEQLQKLKRSLLLYEQAIYEALYTDLKKSPEEAWVTETGMVVAEINAALRHLKTWMRPEKVGTNLLNLPSSSQIRKEPLGVVLIIGPWNYPLQLLFNPLVGAIAAGNCVVLKPSEFAPATAAIMKKVIEDTFPRDYILYLEGEGQQLVPRLMNDTRFDHVFYTGGTAVGRIIYKMAAEKLVPVTLELGGKSPCIIEDDADIKVASRRIALARFSNAGQMCVAPDYMLVHESRKDEMIRAMKATLLQFFGESPEDDYNYGRIINEKQFNRLSAYLAEGRILHGGRTDRSKLFIEPTLLDNISMHDSVMKEEIFGPVFPILTFHDRQEALEMIGQHPDPLAFYVFTGNNKKEKEWLDSVNFGGGCVNNASWHLTNYHLPFGGRGQSGIGKYHGRYSFETFSHYKSVMKTPTWFDPAIKYPPFKGRLKLFKWIIK